MNLLGAILENVSFNHSPRIIKKEKKKKHSPRVFLDKALILNHSWCVGVDIVIVTSEIARLTPPSLFYLKNFVPLPLIRVTRRTSTTAPCSAHGFATTLYYSF